MSLPAKLKRLIPAEEHDQDFSITRHVLARRRVFGKGVCKLCRKLKVLRLLRQPPRNAVVLGVDDDYNSGFTKHDFSRLFKRNRSAFLTLFDLQPNSKFHLLPQAATIYKALRTLPPSILCRISF